MFVNEKRNIRRLFYGIWSIVALLGIATLSFGAELLSDKAEYYAEEIAIFEGHGFNAGESVAFTVISTTVSGDGDSKVGSTGQTDGGVNTGSLHNTWYAQADSEGVVITRWIVCSCPHEALNGVTTFTVTAAGNGGSAQGVNTNSGNGAQNNINRADKCTECKDSLKAPLNIPAPDDIPRVLVDGNDTSYAGEWKPGDLFAHMYEAGDPGKNKTSDASVVFYCNDQGVAQVSVLVKTVGNYFIVKDDSECGENNWIKYCPGTGSNTAKLVDSCNTADFKYIDVGTKTVGYEARFSIPEADQEYNIMIHAAVRLPTDVGTSTRTSATEGHSGNGVCMYIDCDEGGETAVELASFTAGSIGDGKVALNWETSTEVNNAGFNLYRSRLLDGIYKKINEGLIPARDNAATGASYSYEDSPGRGTFYYKLEDVDRNGVTTMHGPEKVRVKK